MNVIFLDQLWNKNISTWFVVLLANFKIIAIDEVYFDVSFELFWVFSALKWKIFIYFLIYCQRPKNGIIN